MFEHRIVSPSGTERRVIGEQGESLLVQEDWEFLPAGDGPLTKLVKAKGETWQVQVRRGRRKISKGIWASARHIREAREEIELKRSAPGYTETKKRALERRRKKQEEYHAAFMESIVSFLDFPQRYQEMAREIAVIVAEPATPIGSGTVARTERIPLQQRASYAVIAWMRHAATDYDMKKIPRIKGRRRQVRAELAARSVRLLDMYREGRDTPPDCPLKQALSQSSHEKKSV